MKVRVIHNAIVSTYVDTVTRDVERVTVEIEEPHAVSSDQGPASDIPDFEATRATSISCEQAWPSLHMVSAP